MAGAPIPTGDCPPDGCDPFATSVVCLSDGTPIAVVSTRDCATGDVSEAGWLDLTTGIFTAGPPPGGTGACGDDYAFALTGWLCDVLLDGSVAGIALVQIERDSSGAVIGITLIGVDGLPYVPQGTMTRCPADDIEAEVLCDAGNAGEPFVRFYTYAPSGAIPARDTDLDGNPYTVIGPAERCVDLIPDPLNVTVQNTPLDVTGTVSTANPCSDIEQVLLTDTGGTPEQEFLRTYEYDCDGNIVGFTDTELDGATAYVPVGPIEVTVRAVASRDIEQEVLCDDQGGTVVPFVRRYRWNPNGSLANTLNITLDGAAYAPVGTVRKCEADDQGPVAITNPDGVSIEVEVTANACADSEYVELLDCTDTRFLRRIDRDCDGTLTVTDTNLDGITPFVSCDPVRFASEGGLQSGAGGPAIVTRVVAAVDYTTSVLARRIKIIWTGNAAAIGNRVGISINGGPFVPLVNQAGSIEFGDLSSPDAMGYTVTIEVNQAQDDVTVVEEF